MTEITFPGITKYDNALYFTLIVMVDDRMAALETNVCADFLTVPRVRLQRI